MINKLFDNDNGYMLKYQGTNNGIIWDFMQFDYDADTQDYTIKRDERRLVRNEIKRLQYGKEFLNQF